jgi:hypothetical protein
VLLQVSSCPLAHCAGEGGEGGEGMIGWLMGTELESMWKEAVVAYSSHYPGMYMEGLRKTQETPVRRARSRAEIRNQNLPNMRQESRSLGTNSRCGYKVTPQHRVVLEMLVVTHLIKKLYFFFLETKLPLPSPQKPVISTLIESSP